MWKCRPFGWLWGLPLLALLGLMVLFGERRNIESDLTDRVGAMLQDAGLGWAKPSFSGRDGVLSGRAAGVKEREDAVALAEKTWGVRIVEEQTELVASVSPYVWSAVKQGGRLVLGGYVPNEDDRRTVVATAKSEFGGTEIVDELKIAPGAPDHRSYLDGIGFGLKQLGGLDVGSVGLSDTGFAIEGLASSQQTYDAIDKAVDNDLPRGLVLTSKNLTAPKRVEPAPVPAPAAAPAPAPAPVVEAPPSISPYVWRADYHSNRVTLSGNIPDEATRATIKTQARDSFPNAEIIDEMETGNGAPADWSGAAGASLVQLARMQTGSATVWDTDVTLRGRAESAERRDEVLRGIFDGLPAGFHGLSHDISVPEPIVAPAEELYQAPEVVAVPEADLKADTPLKFDECQTYLNSILGSNVINFKVASAELDPESFPTLIGLSHVANRCPDTRIEIAGHTDGDGSARFNQMLSLRRARAVVQYLSEEGVVADRLSAVGYGKSRPIAPNTTPENKAKNRRIEFSVKEF